MLYFPDLKVRLGFGVMNGLRPTETDIFSVTKQKTTPRCFLGLKIVLPSRICVFVTVSVSWKDRVPFLIRQLWQRCDVWNLTQISALSKGLIYIICNDSTNLLNLYQSLGIKSQSKSLAWSYNMSYGGGHGTSNGRFYFWLIKSKSHWAEHLLLIMNCPFCNVVSNYLPYNSQVSCIGVKGLHPLGLEWRFMFSVTVTCTHIHVSKCMWKWIDKWQAPSENRADCQ